MTHVMLLGNPNCGKTTLFNALTDQNQRIGNWPGVTVEKKTGFFKENNQTVDVTDLPGIYSLTSSAKASQDEKITARYVVDSAVDIIVNVIDASHLERHLYLTSQLLELGKPVIIALNMMDIATERGITIDCKKLSQFLKIPIIPIQAHYRLGIEELKQHILLKGSIPKPLSMVLPSAVHNELGRLQSWLMSSEVPQCLTNYYAHRLMEGDTLLLDSAPDFNSSVYELDIVLADARYQAIHEITQKVQHKASDASEHWTARIDSIVLHRVWALPIFLATMYLMFLFAINIGGVFQDFFDISTDALFVQGLSKVLTELHSPPWLIALLANGFGKGINTTITFIPVIAAMFFFLSWLELSGYMARAAFVVDKFMRILGLPGKSFVPMIVGFGCNVPAIMAARTLDSERDRLLTILMSPFMSCSARLAIYAVFVAAFFPTGGQNIVFSLYLVGILMAVFTGFLLRKIMLQGQASPLILELPAYHTPSFRRLVKETSRRLRHFIVRAGKLIIPVCIILGGLNALTIHGGIQVDEASSDSILSWFGRALTPMFSPMGLQQDNWPATVGLLSGMLAKEVVVGSLNTLYMQMTFLTNTINTSSDVWGMLQEALWSVPENLAKLGQALLNPIAASAPDNDVSHTIYGVMNRQFDGKVGAYAYLLFILLYIPCVSTMAVIRQEANRTLMWFSVLWSFVIAYASAVIFYQMATFFHHPILSIGWLVCMLSIVILAIFCIQRSSRQQGVLHVVANS